MNKQQTFSDMEYSHRKKKTEEFLKIMNEIIPWDKWVAYIEPYYPTGERGRPPMGIEKMLRMYLGVCQGSCRMGLKSFCKNSNGYIFQSQ
jgi:IS5 family transposase